MDKGPREECSLLWEYYFHNANVYYTKVKILAASSASSSSSTASTASTAAGINDSIPIQSWECQWDEEECFGMILVKMLMVLRCTSMEVEVHPK